jgi:hypothetical protein
MLGWSPRLVQRPQAGGPAGDGYGRPSPLGYLSCGSGDVVAPDHAGRVQERQVEPGHGANPSAILLHSREPLDSGALASHELQPSRLDSLPVSLPRSRHGPLLPKRRKGTREPTHPPPCVATDFVGLGRYARVGDDRRSLWLPRAILHVSDQAAKTSGVPRVFR